MSEHNHLSAANIKTANKIDLSIISQGAIHEHRALVVISCIQADHNPLITLNRAIIPQSSSPIADDRDFHHISLSSDRGGVFTKRCPRTYASDSQLECEIVNECRHPSGI